MLENFKENIDDAIRAHRYFELFTDNSEFAQFRIFYNANINLPKCHITMKNSTILADFKSSSHNFGSHQHLKFDG